MTDHEAMKMALEALEKDPVPLNAINNAKYFLRQALAQPEREWVGLTLDDIPETFVGDWSFLEGARWAGAKLKEKNT